MWVAPVSTSIQTPTVQRTGTTVWLTGLPCAGKTTLALALAQALRETGRDVEILDGDEIRTYLSAGLGFSRADRDTHVRRIGFVAELLARHGVVVLVPVIAPYADTRDEVRAAARPTRAPRTCRYTCPRRWRCAPTAT